MDCEVGAWVHAMSCAYSCNPSARWAHGCLYFGSDDRNTPCLIDFRKGLWITHSFHHQTPAVQLCAVCVYLHTLLMTSCARVCILPLHVQYYNVHEPYEQYYNLFFPVRTQAQVLRQGVYSGQATPSFRDIHGNACCVESRWK